MITMKYVTNVISYLTPMTESQTRYVLWWGEWRI
jgi:hypothetical protein